MNADKFGHVTPGTGIPIVSEDEMRAAQPDYVLVLPWHFRDGIVEREEEYIRKRRADDLPAAGDRDRRRLTARRAPAPSGRLPDAVVGLARVGRRFEAPDSVLEVLDRALERDERAEHCGVELTLPLEVRPQRAAKYPPYAPGEPQAPAGEALADVRQEKLRGR